MAYSISNRFFNLSWIYRMYETKVTMATIPITKNNNLHEDSSVVGYYAILTSTYLYGVITQKV
jgi:hypothetical protein